MRSRHEISLLSNEILAARAKERNRVVKEKGLAEGLRVTWYYRGKLDDPAHHCVIKKINKDGAVRIHVPQKAHGQSVSYLMITNPEFLALE